MTNQIELEFPACPLCRSERREMSYGQCGEHKIMRCQDCSVHYLYPRLSESAMRRYYENDNYFEGGDSGIFGHELRRSGIKNSLTKVVDNELLTVSNSC